MRILSPALLALSILALSPGAYAQDNDSEDTTATETETADVTDATETETADVTDTTETETADVTGSRADGAAPATTGAAPSLEDAPLSKDAIRLRIIQQKVQAIKHDNWRAKARVGMLGAALVGDGTSATITHRNEMGNSFRLLSLVYTLDGKEIFSRQDDSGALHDNDGFNVFSGPISPGKHDLNAIAIYRGNGRGVFRYLNEFRFTVRATHRFAVLEGRTALIDVLAHEQGGVSTPLEERPALTFRGEGTIDEKSFQRTQSANAARKQIKEQAMRGVDSGNLQLVHKHDMGLSFRLLELTYWFDGKEIFFRADESGGLDEQLELQIYRGPVAPGAHNVRVLAVYSGRAAGPLTYLDGFRFKVEGSYDLTAGAKGNALLTVRAFDEGGPTTKLEARPKFEFNVEAR